MYSYIRFSDGLGSCLLGISNFASIYWYLFLVRSYLSTSESFVSLCYFQNEESARLALDAIACASGEVIYNDMLSV